MSRFKKISIFFGIVLLIIIIATPVYLWNDGLFVRAPQNPEHSYFPNEWSEYAGSKWMMLYFQPYFVKQYVNASGQIVLKTRYRDVEGKERYIDVFVSGEVALGVTANSGFQDERSEGPNGKYILAKDNLNLLKQGEQISITYLKLNDTQEPISSNTIDADICDSIPDYCNIGIMADSQSRELNAFGADGYSNNKDFIVPAFAISNEFVEEYDEARAR